jgi:hypothetical protein
LSRGEENYDTANLQEQLTAKREDAQVVQEKLDQKQVRRNRLLSCKSLRKRGSWSDNWFTEFSPAAGSRPNSGKCIVCGFDSEPHLSHFAAECDVGGHQRADCGG